MEVFKMTVLQEIEKKAMQLPYSERGHLVYDLLSTFEQPISNSDAYEKEIQQRIAAIKSGTAVGAPADQVFSVVENKYA
jgi:putative addiction module component (TIGR02574 family)